MGRVSKKLKIEPKVGFTLIEVLMIVLLLGVVLAVGSNLFFSILKGGSKAEILKEVKQNGDYAIAVMERMTRNASEAVCCFDLSCLDQRTGEEVGYLQITNSDRRTTTFFLESSEEVLKIASNSGVYLTSKNVNASSGGFVCEGETPEVITISFTLSQKGTPLRVEEKATQNFQTTVSLRTYD